MYSPKIDEELIPVLYHTAKARGIPMTKLVTILIGKALAAEENLPLPAHEAVIRFVGSCEREEAAS